MIPTFAIVPLLIAAFVVLTIDHYQLNPVNPVRNIRFGMMASAVLMMFLQIVLGQLDLASDLSALRHLVRIRVLHVLAACLGLIAMRTTLIAEQLRTSATIRLLTRLGMEVVVRIRQPPSTTTPVRCPLVHQTHQLSARYHEPRDPGRYNPGPTHDAATFRRRWLSPLVALPLLLGTPALAQTQSAQQQSQINRLLDGLKAAPSPAAAAALEGTLQSLWVNQGSPSARLLMGRGLREMDAGNYAQAVQSFDDVVTLEPNSAEGYRQLAMARYAAGDTQGAIEDLALAVQHEPRNFLAYKSLSEIAAQRGDWKGAYEAWQKLLALDPNTPGGQDKLKELQVKAFGQEL
jgi:cytochrome c-type biogenesis protein CcmH/NrfG